MTATNQSTEHTDAQTGRRTSGHASLAMGHHPMVVYAEDDQLCDMVGRGVLATALAQGDTAMVVATAAHRVGIAAVLRAVGIDVDRARTTGRYVEFDATDLLASVTDEGRAGTSLWTTVVAAHEQAARRAGGRLLVYSETAGLLWEQGRTTEALELEALADQLLEDLGIDVVCAHRGAPSEVCKRHTAQLDRTTANLVPAALGAPEGVDPLARHQVRRLVHDQLELALRMLDSVDAAVVATDLDGTVLAWNEGARRLHGRTAEQAIGRHLVEATLAVPDGPTGPTWQSIVDGGGWDGQLDVRRLDGSTVPAQVRNRVVHDADGRPVAFIGVATDLTEQRAREQAERRRASWLHDVTILMHEGLAILDPHGRIVSVNPYGERLLAAPDGTAVGGSFVNRLLPVRADGSVADISEALIGAEFDGHLPAEPTEARLLHADGTTVPIEYVATEIPPEADETADGWVVVFRDITDRLERDRQVREDAEHARWMSRIRQALDHDEFVLHAQPIVDLRTGATVQHELLLRLRDGEDLISPGAFLPTAEAYGLAPAIDRWVVGQAVDLAARGLPVQVNLSARSFADPTLPHLVRQLLDQTGADPALLVFELTETAMLGNEKDAATFAARIRGLGCRLALDDFGTGYGALTYLKHLPVDLLKIDMEFVRDALTNPASRHVISAVVTLAVSLGIHTIAEGVEDEATLQLLAELGVDQAQGFLLGCPAPLPSA